MHQHCDNCLTQIGSPPMVLQNFGNKNIFCYREEIKNESDLGYFYDYLLFSETLLAPKEEK